jgi:hypothetical protein
MTPQEHLFFLTLYARQSFKFNILYEILKSQGLIQNGDLQAYQALFSEEKPQEFAAWLKKSWESYQATAVALGVTTGLEHGPTPPKKA